MKNLITSILGLIAIIGIGCQQVQIPKNIILMISDGCGYNQIEAASLYKYGVSNGFAFQKFPANYANSTYSTTSDGYDPNAAWKTFEYHLKKPTDSAASGTAMACGIKTYNGAIAVDTLKNPVETIAERAEKLGKSSGVVSSVLFFHATPASFASHDSARGNYQAIVEDMIDESQLDVILGCGHPYYDDNGDAIPEEEINPDIKRMWEYLKSGEAGGDADNDGIADPWILIEEKQAFEALTTGTTPKRVIGIPRVGSTLQQSRSGDRSAEPYKVPKIETVPTLADMSRGALNVLDDDADGFFLMIEAGAVDWASHSNQSGRMIEEEIDFAEAIDVVIQWVEQNSSWEETLVMVTGDHETGYLCGPGSGAITDSAANVREAKWNPLVNNGKGKLPGMEWHSGGHSNSLIPFFAKGTGSQMFDAHADETDQVRGKYIDNIEIGKVMFALWPEKNM